MNITSPTKSPARVVLALVALLAAMFATLLSAPAPTASAAWSGVVAQPGPYQISVDAMGRQAMTRAHIYTAGKRTFYTNGVRVARSIASTNRQTVTATYKLQYWSYERNTWVAMQQATKSATIDGYVAGAAYPTVALAAHFFDNPPLLSTRTPYRITYTINWVDAVTQQLLGSRDVYPHVYNNFCPDNPENPTPCQVFEEDVQW
jgi:hypothetical protein